MLTVMDDKSNSKVRGETWEEVEKRLLERDHWPISWYYFLRYRLINNLRGYWREFKGFFHRGLYGYAKHDLWSFECYLAGVIGRGVKELGDKSYGYPSSLNGFEEWKEILDKMSEGFLYYRKNVFEFKEEKDYKEVECRLNESLDLFKKHFMSLWD